MRDIIEEIIKAFSSLWKIKQRGDSIEIITPVTTSNDSFVSVFLTRRGDEYVVTDGGWIDAGVYNIDEESNINFNSIVNHFQASYGILSLHARGLYYYYKKTDSPIFVPNLVFDVASFISVIVNTSLVEASRGIDKNYNKFSRKAKNFIIDHVAKEDVVSTSSLRKIFPSLHFGFAIRRGSGISLFNFSSGSNKSYYINSLCKSKVSFEIVKKSDNNNCFQDKILLLDDNNSMLRNRDVGVYVNLIREQEVCSLINWSDRESIFGNAV